MVVPEEQEIDLFKVWAAPFRVVPSFKTGNPGSDQQPFCGPSTLYPNVFLSSPAPSQEEAELLRLWSSVKKTCVTGLIARPIVDRAQLCSIAPRQERSHKEWEAYGARRVPASLSCSETGIY